MKLKHLIKKESGQAMVEFALVLPLLLLFVGGIIDFGWIFHNQIIANNDSREAARYIAIHYKVEGDSIYNSIPNATAKAKSMIGNWSSVTVSHSDDGGEYITVSFDRDVKILTPILTPILDKDGNGVFTISSKCTMRVEK